MSKYIITLSSLLIVACLATVTISAELVAYYTFEGTSDTLAVDASGNGNDATIISAKRVEGYRGNALEFFGAENVILPAANMGMNAFTGSLTFWMKIAEGDLNSIYTIFWGGDNETGGWFWA